MQLQKFQGENPNVTKYVFTTAAMDLREDNMVTIGNKRVTKNGEYFDVIIDGVTIYGCQYKSGTGAKGDYEFVATPQRKGKDKDGNDKWYACVKLDAGTAEQVMQAYRGEDPF